MAQSAGYRNISAYRKTGTWKEMAEREITKRPGHAAAAGVLPVELMAQISPYQAAFGPQQLLHFAHSSKALFDELTTSTRYIPMWRALCLEALGNISEEEVQKRLRRHRRNSLVNAWEDEVAVGGTTELCRREGAMGSTKRKRGDDCGQPPPAKVPASADASALDTLPAVDMPITEFGPEGGCDTQPPVLPPAALIVDDPDRREADNARNELIMTSSLGGVLPGSYDLHSDDEGEAKNIPGLAGHTGATSQPSAMAVDESIAAEPPPVVPGSVSTVLAAASAESGTVAASSKINPDAATWTIDWYNLLIATIRRELCNHCLSRGGPVGGRGLVVQKSTQVIEAPVNFQDSAVELPTPTPKDLSKPILFRKFWLRGTCECCEEEKAPAPSDEDCDDPLPDRSASSSARLPPRRRRHSLKSFAPPTLRRRSGRPAPRTHLLPPPCEGCDLRFCQPCRRSLAAPCPSCSAELCPGCFPGSNRVACSRCRAWACLGCAQMEEETDTCDFVCKECNEARHDYFDYSAWM
ncbi:hypothetical protein HDU96_005990 [Phlyctochytrium bullatum]|nr:hypothetical protein HDU96_005990 [Phlyctochytrium bullatum]